MCVGYRLNGKSLESWPIHHEIIKKCEPIYQEFEGWPEKTREGWSSIAKEGYEALPENMKIYIQAIKKELQTDVAMISIGPKREDTIVLDYDYFN